MSSPCDPIAALCQMVREAGLTMTLYGVPVTEEELRSKALDHAMGRPAARVAHDVRLSTVGDWAVCPDDGGEIWLVGGRTYSIRRHPNSDMIGWHQTRKDGRWWRGRCGFSGGAGWLAQGRRLQASELAPATPTPPAR